MNNLQNLEPATLGFNSSGQAHQLLAQTAAQAILYLLILIIALPLNILVLVLVYKCRPLRSVPNIFVASLALADFLIALLGLPAIVIATVAQSWPFGVTLCQTSGFLTFSLRNVSILSVAGIAVDRYYVIARPFILVVTREKAKKMIVFLWWNGLLCGIPPLFGLGLYKFSPSRCLCDYSWLDGGSSLAYGIYLFIWIYVMSLLLVTISYYFIYRVTSEHVKQKAQRFASSFPPEQEATSIPMEFSSFRLLQSSLSRKWASFISSNSNFNTSSSSDVAMESKTTRTIVAVVTTYLVTWVPYFIVNFHPGSAYGRKVPKMLDFLVTWLTFVNCALNPVLYAILNRQFRRCLRENIGLWFGVFTQQASEGVPAPAAIAQNGGIGKRPTSNENSPPPFSVSRELPRSVSPTFLRESSLYTSSPNPCSVFSQRRASPAQRPHSHIAV